MSIRTFISLHNIYLKHLIPTFTRCNQPLMSTFHTETCRTELTDVKFATKRIKGFQSLQS